MTKSKMTKKQIASTNKAMALIVRAMKNVSSANAILEKLSGEKRSEGFFAGLDSAFFHLTVVEKLLHDTKRK